MSQENVEVIRRLYEGMNARDVAGTAELLHPDAEWIPDERVGEGAIRGRENVIRFFLGRAEAFGRLHLHTERMWETDDKVLVFIHVIGRGEASGAEFEIRIGHLWTVRNGLVVRGEGYGDRTMALDAVGLRE